MRQQILAIATTLLHSAFPAIGLAQEMPPDYKLVLDALGR